VVLATRFACFVAILFASIGRLGVCQDPVLPAADAPQPHSPGESQRMFQLDTGFRIELVAAEPDLADPVAICFDADGHIFAAEIHGYNLDGYFDVQELNKTGRLDKQVRRVSAPDWAKGKAEQFTYGTVKQLHDEDGDGQVDRSSVFADRLPPCYGLVPSRDGVIVLCSPDIYFLADRDGDGAAEIQQRLFTGLNEGELWSRANHLVLGLDNWVYACSGRGDSQTITGPGLSTTVTISGSNFRFRADGSAFEPATGGPGGFGLGMTDWGDQFLVHNSTSGLQVTPIPFRYQQRNPDVAAPAGVRSAAAYHDVYPVSQPHPWRVERGSQQAWREFYGQGEATPNGSFTAACSPTVYRGGAFPDQYQGNLFTCESQQNLLTRSVIQWSGTVATLSRPVSFQQREFVASSEGWFRPVNLANGPDGGLYIVDMYREIIEDYSAIPRYLQQQYGLEKGGDRGRIWRVVYGNAQSAQPIRLSSASIGELVAALNHPNAVWRQTAQRLLVERQDPEAIDGLNKLLVADSPPETRIHLLYTLQGLNSLNDQQLITSLRDECEAVRVHALRLSDSRLSLHSPLVDLISGMVDDPSAKVRLQAALTIGEIGDTEIAAAALASLAEHHLDDPWMVDAIMSSVGTSAVALVARLIDRPKAVQAAESLLEPLCKMIVSRDQGGSLGELLAVIADRSDSAETTVVCLSAILAGLEETAALDRVSAARPALVRFLKSTCTSVNLLAYRIATRLRLDDLPEVNEMFAQAERRALDDQWTAADRVAAVDLLSGAAYEQIQSLAGKLLNPQQPTEVQLALVDTLSATESADAAELLLQGWRGYTPPVQQRVLEGIFSRQDRLGALLTAIEDETVHPAALTPLQRLRLLENSDPEIAERAAVVIQATSGPPQEILAGYRRALSQPRDAVAGKAVFKAACAACHRVEGQGFDVGPALSSAINRPDEALLSEILQPSARITQGYRVYNVVTLEGRVFTGVMAGESATSITLRRDKGERHTILRKDIDQLVASNTSLMPDDLHKQVSPTELANLLGYLRTVYGPAAPVSVPLFDEDGAFVDQLNDGSGTATLVSTDASSGRHSLAITPLQKYSPQIADWNFPIVENPGPGQYRYLRLDWKCEPGAEGVLLEIAASGRWPDSKSPVRRYYSGKNTTDWEATKISDTVPQAWTTITVDLWKDCGEFRLTGIAPTAMGGRVYFDNIRLYRTLEDLDE